MLLLSILIGTTLAESSISTDRPSVGTSALVLQKGSIQLESGIQRYSYSEEERTNCTDPPCNFQRNIDTFYNMVRIGITPTFELRPYNDLHFTDLSSTITGIQGKINLYSSDENPHALVFLYLVTIPLLKLPLLRLVFGISEEICGQVGSMEVR